MGAFASIFVALTAAALVSISLTWAAACVLFALFRFNPWVAALGALGPLAIAFLLMWRS